MSRWTKLETLGLALIVAFFGLLWWPAALLVAGVLLVGAAFVITRFALWEAVGEAVMTLGALGLAAWGLVLVALLSVVAFLALRRATP